MPKTGSTSIRSILGIPPKPHLNIWQTKYELENYWTHYQRRFYRLLSAAYLLLPAKTRLEIGKRQFQNYFKFGFVRNPWDRMVSLYERREGLQLNEQLSFEKFVEWAELASSTCVHPVPHRNQLDWFIDPHGKVLVDFIGQFERLSTDWAIIAEKLALPRQLPHANKNPRRNKHYTEYYNQRTRDLVGERFRIDIEYFRYEFNAAPRPAVVPC